MELREVSRILIEQEEKFVFSSFDKAEVLKLGLSAIEAAKNRNSCVAISIRDLAGIVLFQYMFNGTTASNASWLDRKHRTVCLTGKSTLRLHAELLAEDPKDPLQLWYLEPGKYSIVGGGFPVKLKGSGLVGTFCISGLPHELDHDLAIDALCGYFAMASAPRILQGDIQGNLF